MSFPLGCSVGVVGGGLSGLAVAFHAAKTYQCSVTVYESEDIGSSGASALASLMHPHSPRGKLIWRGVQGVEASLELLDFAATHCTASESVFYKRGNCIRRPCFNKEQEDMFVAAANLLPQYISYESNENSSSGSSCLGTALYKNSYLINTPQYLRSLMTGLASDLRVKLVRQKMSSNDVYDHLSSQHDLVVLCAGAGLIDLHETELSRLTLVRGQNLLYDKPSEVNLNEALICGEYVVPADGVLICGATHEYSSASLASPPSVPQALALLSSALINLYPPIANLTPTSASAAVRVVPPRNHLGKTPMMIATRRTNVFALTGFGSHGLVHHALLSRMLLGALITAEDGTVQPLPNEMIY